MHDFDFFVGSWAVANRRLPEPLTGSDRWTEFPGTAVAHSLFDGAGNFDEIIFPTEGWRGATLRLFDPAEQRWSLYWASSRSGRLDPPVTGRFTDGVGEFHGDDVWRGRPIRVRYRWSGVTPTSARWEQAFSADDGRTWEDNWFMDFSRTA